MDGRILGMLLFSASTLLGSAAFGQTSAESHGRPHEHGHAHAAPGELPTPYPDRIALTWSADPASSLSVTWRTDTTVTASFAQVAVATAEPSFFTRAETVEAATEVLDLSHIEDEYVVAHYHSATFTGLRSDTLYAYRVGDGMRWSEWFHARTADSEPKPMSFLYFGDAQNGIRSHWSRAIRAAYSEAPDALFAIHAGDLVGGAHNNIEWGQWHQAGGFIHSMLPSLPVPGNHEYDEFTEEEGDLDVQHLSAHWRPGFTLPMNGAEDFKESTYFLDIQGLRVIGLDSEPATEDARALAVQTAWLDSVLTNNTNRWTIATFHHPIFSSGEGRDNPNLRATWKPLFDKHRVDLVLQGHDHTYARGRAENVAEGVNVRSPLGGTVYVNSVSGAKMYTISPGRWENYYGSVEMERAAENTQLFQVLRIDGDTLRFKAYTVTGELYDAFDLVKGQGNAPNAFIERVPRDTPERTHENTIPYARFGDGGEEDDIEGTVRGLGHDFVEVGGSRFRVTDATLFDGGTWADVREGAVIEIEFVRDADGGFTATEIELDDVDRDVRNVSGAVTGIETVGARTFLIVGDTRHEIVSHETEFLGIDGIEGLVVDDTIVVVDYRLNAEGDGYVAVQVEVGGHHRDHGDD